jgi:uncharacterized membrane protein YdjX (TVP38/TMEM64 family)
MKTPTLVRLGVVVLLGSVIAGMVLFVDVRTELRQLLQWVQELGDWGALVLAAVYVPATVLFIPGSLLTLGAGFAFGLVRGTLAVSAGSVLGATAAFLLGRFLLRGWIERKVARYPRFRAIDQAVAEQGFKIVLLTRLSPAFPFILLNYAFGLTRVRLRDYVLASWIGMLPGTVMYVYLGFALRTLVTDVAELDVQKVQTGIAPRLFVYAGLAVAVLATIYITRVARKALDQATARYEDETRAALPASNHHD